MKIIVNHASEDLKNLTRTNVTFGMDPEDFLFEFGFGISFSGYLSLIRDNIYRFNVDMVSRNHKVEVVRVLDPNNPKEKALLTEALHKDYNIDDFIIVKEGA